VLKLPIWKIKDKVEILDANKIKELRDILNK